MLHELKKEQNLGPLVLKDIRPDITSKFRESNPEDVFVKLCTIIILGDEDYKASCSHAEILNSFPKDVSLRKEWLNKVCDLIDNTIMPPRCFCSRIFIQNRS